MPSSFILRHEKFIFLTLVLIHLIPVCSTHFFPTLDGPAHLYNANLINWMLQEPDGLASHFFYFNQPVPNLSGHALMSFFHLFLPAYLVEKSILILYVVSLPVCFRLLVKTLKPDQLYTSYLIFPFIYSYLFYQGFFNFCLSLPVYFFTLQYWFKIQNRFSFKTTIRLFLLLTFLYFSHLMSFLLFIGTVITFTLWEQLFLNWSKKNTTESKSVSPLGKRLLFLLLAAAPCLILCCSYLKSSMGKQATVFLSTRQLLNLISECKALLTLSYVTWLPWIFLFIMITIIIKKYLERKQKQWLTCNDVWFVLMLLVLLLLFLLPDQTASGGFVSMRITLYIYLICLIWFTTQEIPKPVVYIAVLLSMFISVVMLRFYRREAVEQDKIALQYQIAADSMEENSVVLPLNYSGYLINSNMLTYIGSEKKLVILDNYEAITTHFPLKWRSHYFSDSTIGNYLKSNRPWVKINLLEKKINRKVDYVVRGCFADTMNDPATQFMNQVLGVNYKMILQKEFVRVYKRINN